MSAVTVRNAISTLLNANLATIGVDVVYNYRQPLVADGVTQAVVYINRYDEIRRGLGGAMGQGKKWVEYDATIYLHRTTHDTTGVDEDAFYNTIDAIRTLFRANQTLSAVVRRFGEDIEVEVEVPVLDSSTIQFQAQIVAHAVEEIVG